MKKIIIICILCFLGINSYSQLLEDKTNLYLGYQGGKYLGSELFNDYGTIAPSFYSNFRIANGVLLKGMTKISDHISTGLSISVLNASNWQNKNYSSYLNATSTVINFMPIFQYHTAFKQNGLYNRLKLYGEVSPVIGLSMVSLPSSIFHVVDPNNETSPIFKSNEMIYGFRLGVGSRYAFTNDYGLFMEMSINQVYLTYHPYVDTKYTLSTITFGMYFNLSKVKRFNY